MSFTGLMKSPHYRRAQRDGRGKQRKYLLSAMNYILVIFLSLNSMGNKNGVGGIPTWTGRTLVNSRPARGAGHRIPKGKIFRRLGSWAGGSLVGTHSSEEQGKGLGSPVVWPQKGDHLDFIQ